MSFQHYLKHGLPKKESQGGGEDDGVAPSLPRALMFGINAGVTNRVVELAVKQGESAGRHVVDSLHKYAKNGVEKSKPKPRPSVWRRTLSLGGTLLGLMVEDIMSKAGVNASTGEESEK